MPDDVPALLDSSIRIAHVEYQGRQVDLGVSANLADALVPHAIARKVPHLSFAVA